MLRLKPARVRDFVAYIAVGVAVVVAVYWWSLHSGPDSESVGKWGGLVGTTLILFGYAIQEHWPSRRRTSFWLTACVLLLAHLSAFSIILINIDRWKVLWFVFAFPVENVAIDAVFALTGHKRAPKKRDGTIHKLTGNVHPGR